MKQVMSASELIDKVERVEGERRQMAARRVRTDDEEAGDTMAYQMRDFDGSGLKRKIAPVTPRLPLRN